ncbi:Protein CBG27158 [Caenorhabditis briggsae]|uniref:Protein CBG27158 n=1 Tax=Caenorhabditis briggsae TaxID=6238 RepID=B6IL67_CAEBR|nr:Protein CBG27158 [Caenorhabditis briggsae]CAS00620.1 Protein CBG27158 [Caenorhabditis briggsae]
MFYLLSLINLSVLH